MINLNGTLIPASSKILTVDNRAFKYGDALFETIKVENSIVIFLEDHYFRLMASMRMLRMEIPLHFTMEFFENEILKTVTQQNLKAARVRFNVYRKDGGLYTPLTNEIDYLVTASELNINIKDIYTLDVFKDYYVYSGLLSTIKTTNKITNVLASIYAQENTIDNCVLLNEKKNVVEAIHGNIFIVKGTSIKTPLITDGCVRGIVRKKIIEMLSESSTYTIEECSISPFELQKADEVFVTNAIVGIQPVTNYKKVKFGTATAIVLMQQLKALV